MPCSQLFIIQLLDLVSPPLLSLPAFVVRTRRKMGQLWEFQSCQKSRFTHCWKANLIRIIHYYKTMAIKWKTKNLLDNLMRWNWQVFSLTICVPLFSFSFVVRTTFAWWSMPSRLTFKLLLGTSSFYCKPSTTRNTPSCTIPTSASERWVQANMISSIRPPTPGNGKYLVQQHPQILISDFYCLSPEYREEKRKMEKKIFSKN